MNTKKTAYIRARVEPQLKQSAEDILAELGISPTQAITMLYKHILRDGGWPMVLKISSEQHITIINHGLKNEG